MTEAVTWNKKRADLLRAAYKKTLKEGGKDVVVEIPGEGKVVRFRTSYARYFIEYLEEELGL